MLQGTEYTMLQLATDLLHLHAIEELRPLHDTQTSCQPLSLDELHQKCLTTFAAWFTELLLEYPVDSFLAASSRTATDTSNQLGLRDDPALCTAQMRQQRAIDIVSYTGRKVHTDDSQLLTDRFALIAHGRSIHDDHFARALDTQVENSMVRLVDVMKTSLAEKPFMQKLLSDPSKTSLEEAAFLHNFEQGLNGSQQFPHHLWRLIAIC